MIDELLRLGLDRLLKRYPAKPQLFLTPFNVGLEHVHSEFEGRPCGMRPIVDPLIERLLPMQTVVEDTGTEGALGAGFTRPPRRRQIMSWEWARPPFPLVVMAGPSRESALVVWSGGSDPSVWEMAAVTRIDHALGIVLAWLSVDRESYGVGVYCPSPRDDGKRGLVKWWASESARIFTEAGFPRLAERQMDVGAFVDGALESYCDNDIHNVTTALAADALTLFALLGARNVTTDAVTPTLSRAARRRGEGPPVSYHVLKVQPLSALAAAVAGAPTGAHMPIHWVRGHFKVFTAERPLFGRFSGRFWWQPGLHGRDRSRRVDKDYRVDSQ